MGKKGALIFCGYSVFNRRINEIFSRTMTNGVEAVLCMIGFYFYSKLTYKKQTLTYDKNLALMTLSITLAFLIRSSSLIGWIPLALVSIFSTQNIFSNLFSIIQAGVLVAIPTIGFSIALDSWYYGKLAIPQYNFVYINVVQNLSNKFGIEVWFYYIF